MADEADRANEIAERNLNMALQAQKKEVGEYSPDCIECGELIPQARQEATGGTDLCFLCASNEEQKAKHFRRQGW